jgi:predicted TIM-barrel fold metal-dependent hydrolase
VLYGTDLTLNPTDDAAEFKASAHDTWTNDWRYLATDETQRVEMIKADVKGLALPREVIDKIFFANARKTYGLN